MLLIYYRNVAMLLQHWNATGMIYIVWIPTYLRMKRNISDAIVPFQQRRLRNQ